MITPLPNNPHNLYVYTIGVYGYDETTFFQRLAEYPIDVFCDIRARRGMRGSEYAFANSQRLQARLAELGIPYLHVKALAPTEAIRDEQKAADKQADIKKRQRNMLSDAYIAAYQEQVLSSFDLDGFLQQLPQNASSICLFCVERVPEACHRSLAADYLAKHADATIYHIRS